jgi:hypothetical protein
MASPEIIRGERASPIVRISVDDLGEHLATLEAELSGGRPVALVRGETVIAEVRAPEPVALRPNVEIRRDLPDFMGRMRDLWGDTVFPEGTGTRWIREDRDARG